MRSTAPRLRHVAAASLATLALAGLSACGGDDTATKASDTSVTSSAATAGAGSTSASVQTPPLPGSDVSPADIAALFKTALTKATTAHVTLTSDGGATSGLHAEGDADYRSPIKLEMTLTIPQIGNAEVRLVDNSAYLKSDQLTAGKYVKFDLDDPSNPLSSLTDQLDFTKLVEKLQTAVVSAKYVGQEDVDGDQTDHYALTVDTAKIIGDEASALPSAAAGSMPKTLDYDIYLDQDGLFRQAKIDTGGTTGAFTMSFSKWGEDVDITAPPSDEVTEMALPGA